MNSIAPQLPDTSTNGINSNQPNTTIKNCQIDWFGNGIYFNGASGGLIQNNTITAMNNLAPTLHALGDLRGAREVLEQGLTVGL